MGEWVEISIKYVADKRRERERERESERAMEWCGHEL